MIYDAFAVTSYDPDALEARLGKYRDIPGVTHVICEVRGCTPFWDNKDDRFWWLLGRYTHVMVEEDELPGGSPAEREKAQRDFLSHGLSGAQAEDIILRRPLAPARQQLPDVTARA